MSILQQVKEAQTGPTDRAATGSPPGQPVPEPRPSGGPSGADMAPSPATRASRVQAERSEAFLELKARIHEELIHELDPDQLTGDTSFLSPVRQAVQQAAQERLIQAEPGLNRQDRERLASEIADEVLGFGPLEPLLRDRSVSEVMVNGYDRVFYESNGIIHLSEIRFRDDAHVLHIVDKILRPLGRRLDETSPMVDARLPDGSRVNAIIPPLAVRGPSVTIRKFSRDLLGVEDLIRLGSLTRPALDYLAACVRARLNVLVSGGTGTGKTTLLNLLSTFIPPRERLVSIEDPAELQIKHIDWVSLETRPPNLEGRGSIFQRELVKNALRMRPDRIIVGECRGAEAFDMLQAMNTGHDGSLTTVHANSPRDSLARLENMVLMAVELPVQAIREQIASGINVLVQIARMQDGSRRVTHISEIVGMQGSVVSMQDLFVFQHQGITPEGRVLGQLLPSALRPHFMDRLGQYGEHLPVETFLPHGVALSEPLQVPMGRSVA
ncbi:MAG: CpaF family protein [Chloroflexi bacterium]|nr:CpaF family protein [Chloroflexota bacterium]